MRTGTSYMGHHNPTHLETDLRAMQQLRLDDVLVAAQENDFEYFPGKLQATPIIARDNGLRPIAIFWGALNFFGGGRSSRFLLYHPEGFQVGMDGSPLPHGCYVNPACRAEIQRLIDIIAVNGFQGYFIDEPTPLENCYCASCREAFGQWYGGDLAQASAGQRDRFRQRCVVDYVSRIAAYCKSQHPQIETMTCLMPCDRVMWEATSRVPGLDNLGTDIYWTNTEDDIAGMEPIVAELDNLCKQNGKIHHEWMQCFQVIKGREQRILEQGRALIRSRPDALYIWAWQGQVGTAETCDDPTSAWEHACEILREAKA